MPAYAEVKGDIEKFKRSCRMYFAEATDIKQLLEDYPWLGKREEVEKHTSPMDTAIRRQYEKMVADTKMVEERFDRMEEISGIPIRVLLWKYFVEQRPVRQIWDEYNMNNRQFQYLVKKHLFMLFTAN